MEFLASIQQSGYFSLFTMQRVSLWLKTLSFAELSQLNEEIAKQFWRTAQGLPQSLGCANKTVLFGGDGETHMEVTSD
jgi:hypothetical protein